LKTFVVFEPAAGVHEQAAAEQVVVLREKFSWPALFFAPIWLFWQRLWLGLFGYLLALGAIVTILIVVDLDVNAAALTLLLPNIVVAFEASELRRRKLLRQGFRELGIIIADDLEAAERRYFAEWKAQLPTGRRGVTPAPLAGASRAHATPPSQAIVGLFPEPGARS
jgi:hypothetical protein